MKRSLVPLLACPECGSELTILAGAAGDEINEGVLECSGCRAAYPVLEGVPRLLAARDLHLVEGDDLTTQHFAFEFDVYSSGDLDLDSPEVVDYLLFSRTGLGPARAGQNDDFYPTSVGDVDHSGARRQVDGRVVLDAGCGSGRFTLAAARSGAARVVGLELGPHVRIAAERCRGLPNVDFVQGSVLNPPFRAQSFDLVFSIGVLHHTPDPAGGFRALSALVRNGGRQSVWVYPPEYWGGPLRAPFGKAVHALLSRLAPRRAFAVVRRVLYPLGRLQALLARRRWSKVLAAPLFLLSVPRHPRREIMLTTIYDYFCPPIISTHRPEEVMEWFRDSGFREVEPVAVPTAVTGIK